MGFLRLSQPSNVSVLTAFYGNPNSTITAIDTSGGIVTSRDADAFTAQAPYPIHCSASAITATGTTRPFEDLEFNWTVTGPETGDTFVRPTDGATVNSFTDQVSPEAAFFLRTPGTYMITLVCRGKNGAGYTTASVTKTVSFVAFNPTGGTYYLDKNAVGTGDGLSAVNAFTTTAALNAAASTNGTYKTYTNLSIQIKNGSDFTGQVGLQFNQFGYNKYTGVRVQTYGTGAKPIFDDPNWTTLDLTKNTSASNDSPMYDIIFSGLSFKKTTGTASALISVAATSVPQKPIENLYFDNCDMWMDRDTASSYVQIVQFEPGNPDTNPFKAFGFWKCTIANPAVVSHISCGISNSSGQWFFVYGTAISGGGINDKDHHIYPDVKFHELYKWSSFGTPGVQSTRGYCLNLNFDTAAGQPGTVVQTRWHVISENQMTGTNSAVDAGNRGGNFPRGGAGFYPTDPADDTSVQFIDWVVERNAMFGMHGNLLMQPACLVTGTVRDNRAWGNTNAVPFVDTVDLGQYPPTMANVLTSRIYRNRIHIAAGSQSGPVISFATAGYVQPQHWTDNIIADYRSTTANIMQFYFSDMIAAGILIDRNTMWTPNATGGVMFYVNATPKTYAAYRSGTGFDQNGSNTTNPGWPTTATQWSDLN